MKSIVASRGFRIFCWLLAAFVFFHSWIVSIDKDLDVFIAAARTAFAGEIPYHKGLGEAKLQYYYSPFFLVLLYPLKDTSQLFYACVWTALNMYLVFRILQLLSWFFQGLFPDQDQRRLFITLSFLSTVRFTLDNLGLGQMTIILVWASLELVRMWQQDRQWLAGLILALVINVKLIPIAFLAYFVYMGRWKVAAATVLFSVAMVVVPIAAFGYDYNLALHGEWLKSLTGTTVNSIFEDDSRPGLSSWIPSLTMDTPRMFPVRRNFVTLDPSTVQLITNAARALFVLIGVFLISRPWKKLPGRLQAFFDLAVICVLTPLVFPHQGKYALLYTLPAYTVCVAYLLKASPPVHKGRSAPVFWLICISFTLVTLTTDGLITMPGSMFAQYLHLLTYGTFALIAAMWIVKRRQPELFQATA